MRTHLILLGLAAPAPVACDGPAAPSSHNLRVSVSTIGVDRDLGYSVRAGGDPSRFIQTAVFLNLPPGEHDVVLGDIAPNCSVQGPDSLRVLIAPDGLAVAEFQVECRAVTGAIEVAAPATGRDFDANGYRVRVDDAVQARVYAGGSVVVEDLPPGSHVVTLDDFSPNCRPIGAPAQTVLVTAGGLTRDTVGVAFESSCEAITGDVQVLTTTVGHQRDANGYTLTIDGVLAIAPCGFYDYDCEPGAPLMLPPNGSNLLFSVSPGDHTYQIGDVSSNCTVAGGSSRRVSVLVGELVSAAFEVRCEPSADG